MNALGATHLFYWILHAMGVFGPGTPATLRELRTGGQRTLSLYPLIPTGPGPSLSFYATAGLRGVDVAGISP